MKFWQLSTIDDEYYENHVGIFTSDDKAKVYFESWLSLVYPNEVIRWSYEDGTDGASVSWYAKLSKFDVWITFNAIVDPDIKNHHAFKNLAKPKQSV